jgi:hypothetical protein
MWQSWAKSLVGLPGHWGGTGPEDRWGIAARLAAEVPFVVSLDDLDVSFSGGRMPDSELGYALNGRVVGLMENTGEQVRGPLFFLVVESAM